MYHEEMIINGVLCWRGTPDGEFKQYSKEALTGMLEQYSLKVWEKRRQANGRR